MEEVGLRLKIKRFREATRVKLYVVFIHVEIKKKRKENIFGVFVLCVLFQVLMSTR